LIQRRKIAIAYACAIPILLGVLFVDVGALYRLNAQQGQVVQGMTALHDFDDLLSALRDAEMAEQGYLASGSNYYRSGFDDAISRASGALRTLDQLLKNDPRTQVRMQEVGGLAVKRISALEQAMDSRDQQVTARANSRSGLPAADSAAEISRIVAEIRMDEEARSQQEQVSAARSASTVDSLVKYGGVLAIWMAGVAALLLFYDDTERFRERIERRLHTDVLESLPLGVCLASESGVILYANPAAESTFGYKSGELVARNLALLHELDESGAESQVARILAQLLPREIWSGELRLRTKDGKTVRTESWIASIRVGEKDCRLLVHSAWPWQRATAKPVASTIRPAREVVEGTATPPHIPAPGGRERTTLPGSEGIAGRGAPNKVDALPRQQGSLGLHARSQS
jgi:PAS domain S-box-containing protein